MRESKNVESQTTEREDPSFMDQLRSLPSVLQAKFLKHIGTALALAVITVLFMLHFKEWWYCIGFLIALYIAYLGLDVVWSFCKEKIVCKQMVCIKANKLPKQDRLYTVMREVDTDESAKNAVHKFYIAGTKKELSLITPHTVLNVYFRPDSPLEITAWEVVDYTGE